MKLKLIFEILERLASCWKPWGVTVSWRATLVQKESTLLWKGAGSFGTDQTLGCSGRTAKMAGMFYLNGSIFLRKHSWTAADGRPFTGEPSRTFQITNWSDWGIEIYGISVEILWTWPNSKTLPELSTLLCGHSFYGATSAKHVCYSLLRIKFFRILRRHIPLHNFDISFFGQISFFIAPP